jgi:hypothetical protein
VIAEAQRRGGICAFIDAEHGVMFGNPAPLLRLRRRSSSRSTSTSILARETRLSRAFVGAERLESRQGAPWASLLLTTTESPRDASGQLAEARRANPENDSAIWPIGFEGRHTDQWGEPRRSAGDRSTTRAQGARRSACPAQQRPRRTQDFSALPSA